MKNLFEKPKDYTLTYIVIFSIICVFYFNIDKLNNILESKKEIEKSKDNISYYYPIPNYYECKIELFFKEGNSIIKNINIYESLDNISLVKGDFIYNKSTKKNGGVVAKKTSIASNVEHYKILEYKLITGKNLKL